MTTTINSTNIEFDEQDSPPSTPTAGKVALYFDTNGQLKILDSGGSPSNATPEDINSIPDVNISGVANDQILQYNSSTTNWENATLTLNSVSDVDAAAPTDGQVLTYINASSDWQPTTLNLTTSLNSLTDVSAATPNPDDILQYNSVSGNWEAAAGGGGGGASTLNDLTDVSAATPDDGQYIMRRGTSWESTYSPRFMGFASRGERLFTAGSEFAFIANANAGSALSPREFYDEMYDFADCFGTNTTFKIPYNDIDNDDAFILGKGEAGKNGSVYMMWFWAKVDASFYGSSVGDIVIKQSWSNSDTTTLPTLGVGDIWTISVNNDITYHSFVYPLIPQLGTGNLDGFRSATTHMSLYAENSASTDVAVNFRIMVKRLDNFFNTA